MTEERLLPAGPAPVWPWLDRCVQALVWALLIYWGLFALFTPVAVTDSLVYNLARLPLAERYGLFGNSNWYSTKQIVFPWSFDALHLGFLYLRFGYALPSFFCLVGTLLVVFRLARAWAGASAAWWTLLLILSMSTIVFQATSTKNDLGVVFAGAAGFYAYWQYRRSREPLWLAILAIALGFLPGIKNSGVIPAAGLALIAAWELRHERRRLLGLIAGTALSALLLGSAETYYNNWLLYGHALGPTDFVAMHSNRDGLRGAAASCIRYLFGAVNLGWTPPYGPPPYVPALERACRAVLRATGLVNVGYWPMSNDATLSILRLGGEGSCDYALIGTCVVPLALWQLVRRSWRSPAWQLAAAGVIYLASIALTVAWMPFNLRFLMPCFILFALAVTVGEQALLRDSRLFRSLLLLLAAFSATIPTYYSFNKQPRDLVGGITLREWEFFLERPTLRPIYQATQAWTAAHPHGRVLLLASGDSGVLAFFMPGMKRVDPLMNPQLRRADLPAGAAPIAVLALDRTDFNPATTEAKVRLLQAFPDPGCALYEVVPDASAAGAY